MKKLAIITTHPIQYNAPLFQLLNERKIIDVKVYYTWGEKVLTEKFDPGFGKEIQWDIPLLEGYPYEFVENISKDPGSHHFKGINNPGLIDIVKGWKPDSILIYGWSFKSHLSMMRYFKGKITVLFRGDSTLMDPINPIKKILRKVFLKWVYKHADKILYAGSNNKKYYQSFGLKENQLIFMPHAIDNARFYPTQDMKKQAGEFKIKLGIEPQATVFLFVGKLENKKNCALLIQAFKEINNMDSHLVVVGIGHLKSELILSAEKNERIHFLDFLNQQVIPVAYQFSDIFVLPSKGPGETWGLSINEAMASGNAVLVSDACGAAIDLVKEGKNGFSFNSNNLIGLKRKMILLLEDRNRLTEMGEESLKMIEEWSYENDCLAIESILI